MDRTGNSHVNPTWDQIKEAIKSSVLIDSNGCWVWQKPLSIGGYGRLWGTGSHRLAYMAYVGPIGMGQDIDHLCRNRACANPAHLEPVTRKENLARGDGIKRQKEQAGSKATCSAGHYLSDDNTYIRPSDGARLCRVCRSTGWATYAQENRDAVNARKRSWRRKWRDQGIRK